MCCARAHIVAAHGAYLSENLGRLHHFRLVSLPVCGLTAFNEALEDISEDLLVGVHLAPDDMDGAHIRSSLRIDVLLVVTAYGGYQFDIEYEHIVIHDHVLLHFVP